ncbi:general secretion pathway protein H [Calothrix sp. NIES-2100]|uniref:type IV pilin-like G/H family protein n=1 Tax=Calothrix sp. NIES-2100 TaxID=1954172 RepID=UPI000B622D42|nr:general secretion pathway protein H [Calothrix sp. NIES-2100]
MKTELKAKFIQYILGKKKEDEGFTLIELLVVIIIIGILSAIALPSFLNQANKAKQSEAKTYVGSLNKGQQAFFTEKGTFGTKIEDLGVGIKTQTVNYKYSSAGSGTGTSSTAYSGSSLTGVSGVIRNYSGMVSLITEGSSSDATSVAILCETTAVAVTAVVPTSGQACAGGSTEVGK